MEPISTLFFHFSATESKDDLVKRLRAAKENGFHRIIASYKTQGMEQANFDETYFEALDRLVDACREEQVKFWLEDYAPFPTGSANGAFKEAEYSGLNKLFIDERHMDIQGPMAGALIRIDALQRSVYGKTMHRFAKVNPDCRRRLGIVACRLRENPENGALPLLEEDSAVVLDGCVENGLLRWDVPQGQWRVFVVYTTYESSGRPYFMNLLSRESVALEIEKVHVPLYEHLKAELGKTWIGFFYDEPETGNAGGDAVFDFFMLPGRRSRQATDCNVYSWSPEMPEEMEKRDSLWLQKLPCLWYDGVTESCGDFRRDYMDAVSTLVRENYNGQVYAFCRERGIGYIGHVLEDENCHTRLGCGPSHYFRQQYYQDEAGIDVIAGQILPGKDRAASWYGVINADGEFYHYGLAKLASSEAHINPLKRNRAAAEVFAMYGQQGLAERKFLLDHLMVNGVNRMLVADLPTYQAPIAHAVDLVNYTDKICGLLRRAKPVIKTAVLYHAESEWREGEKAQKFQKAGAQLARDQISYDVIPADVFAFPERYDADTGKGLTVNGNTYEALIIPGCGKLPEAVAEFVKRSEDTGFPVFFTDRKPDNVGGECVPCRALAERVRQVICPDIWVDGADQEWIRYAHLQEKGAHYYLLHNEAPQGGGDYRVRLDCREEVFLWDVMADRLIRPAQRKIASGEIEVELHLGQYEMAVLRTSTGEKAAVIWKALSHNQSWTLEFADGHRLSSECDVPKPEAYVGFEYYGKLAYQTQLPVSDKTPSYLDLGQVSDCCEVFINGQSAGKRAGTPYVYEVGKLLRPGSNEVRVQVYTSAANIKSPAKIFGISLDSLTAVPHTLVEAPGIRGPVKWMYEQEETV